MPSEAEEAAPSGAAALDASIRAEQVRVLYQKSWLAIPTSLLNAAVLLAVLWKVMSHTALLAWGAVAAAATAVRLLLILAYRRSPRAPASADRWAALFLAGAAANGVIWGAASPLFARPDILAYRVFVIFILAGLAAGTTASASSYPAASLAFTAPALLPAAALLATDRDEVHVAMGLLLLVFGAAMFTIARTGAQAFIESARLRFEAQALRAEREGLLVRYRAAAEESLASLRQKEILLKEVHHRVKNNLQMISSLFNLQAGVVHDPKVLEILRDCRARVRAIATVHQRLYQSADLAEVEVGEYLRALTGDLRRAFDGLERGVDVVVEMEPAGIGLDTAIPCGLVVSELVTNSFKHAFRGVPRGLLRISGKKVEGGSIAISISDNGVGFPESVDFTKSESLGLQLVCMLTRQLKGEIRLFREGGTRFELRFPLAPSASA